jgi:bifunctional glutamyl/prolyl-tRNA synthetase
LKAEFKTGTGTDWKPSVPAQVKSPSQPDIRDKLLSKISEQGDKVRQLKSEKAPKAVIDSEVKLLLALKSEFKSVTGEDWQLGLQPTTVDTASGEMSGDQLSCKIIEQGNIVRKLKAEKAAKVIVDAELKTLLALKGEYKSVTGTEWKPVQNDQKPVKAMTDQKGRPQDNEVADLTQKITDQGNVVRQLKSSGADKVSKLLVLFLYDYTGKQYVLSVIFRLLVYSGCGWTLHVTYGKVNERHMLKSAKKPNQYT